jgi:hypothetical protein
MGLDRVGQARNISSFMDFWVKKLKLKKEGNIQNISNKSNVYTG